MVQIVNSDVSNQYSIAYIGHGSGSPLHIGVSIGVIDIVDINSIHVSNHVSELKWRLISAWIWLGAESTINNEIEKNHKYRNPEMKNP